MRPGYTFAGWHTAADCLTPWDFETDRVTENITLYAKWIFNTATGNIPAPSVTAAATAPAATGTPAVPTAPAIQNEPAAICYGRKYTRLLYPKNFRTIICGTRVYGPFWWLSRQTE
ncbi:MAG: InlB B-repeat-containing protein [Saccharofermentanales bacterium]